jgi:hypothetical protein
MVACVPEDDPREIEVGFLAGQRAALADLALLDQGAEIGVEALDIPVAEFVPEADDQVSRT